MSTTTAAPPVPARRAPDAPAARAARPPRSVKYLALIFFAVLVLTPLYIVLVASFKGAAEADPRNAWSLPETWTFDAWRDAWDQLRAEPEEQPLPRHPGDRHLDRPRLAERVRALALALPGGGRRLPLPPLRAVHPLPGGDDPADAAVRRRSTFPTGIPRLAFAHIVYGIPITTLIFRSYYATIPEDLIEAARMDRAGMLRTYWSVVLPLSAPAFVVTAIWQFTSIWNDFLFAVFLITDPDELARHGGAEQHGRLARDPVQPADVGGAARVAAHPRRLHPARPLLHPRPAGRIAEGVARHGRDRPRTSDASAIRTGSKPSRSSRSRSPKRSCSSSSGRPAAARRPRFAWSPGSRTSASGDLYIGGRRVNDVPEKDRDIAMVFQNYALYPHMTVAQNIALQPQAGEAAEGGDQAARATRPRACSGSRTSLDRRPKQLSGGQRQRVAMGRAIIREPEAFLMDEPLSNLDAQLRVHMRGEIEALQKRLGVTTVYVTHDQIEAMTMGDRVAVLRDGELQQVGHPDRGLRPAGEPLRRRVHGLAADEPRARRRSSAAKGGLVVRLGERDAPDPCRGRAGAEAGGVARTGCHRRHPAGGPRRAARGRTRRLERRSCEVDDRPGRGARREPARALHGGRAAGEDGRHRGDGRAGLEEVALITHEGTPFCAAFAPRSGVRTGNQVEIAVDTNRLHFFDPESEASVRPESKS